MDPWISRVTDPLPIPLEPLEPAPVRSIRGYALHLLTVPTLEAKLAPPPPRLDDDGRGQALRLDGPARPESLRFSLDRARMPKPGGLHDRARRGVALHRFTNHELQAVEIMAWTLLAFPDAPAAFRRGVVQIIAEEQVHMRLYMARMQVFGVAFGDLPVNDYFWTKVGGWTSLLHYVAAMCLTFEAANLDFAQDFEGAFRRFGDPLSADVIARVHADEIRHVRFGITWLGQLKAPEASLWQTFLDHLVFPLHPARARGKTMDLGARRAAGMDEAFLQQLLDLHPAIIAQELGRGGGHKG